MRCPFCAESPHQAICGRWGAICECSKTPVSTCDCPYRSNVVIEESFYDSANYGVL